MKWFTEHVLPALVIALILFIIPILTGIINKHWLIGVIGGVPVAEFQELKTKFDDLSAKALRENDKIWILTQRTDNLGHQLTAERDQGGGFFMQVWPGPSNEEKRQWRLQRVNQ